MRPADGKGGLSIKSVREVHVLLRKALPDAAKWGLVHRNVATLTDSPPAHAGALDRRAKIRVWEAEQLASFLNHLRGDPLYAL